MFRGIAMLWSLFTTAGLAIASQQPLTQPIHDLTTCYRLHLALPNLVTLSSSSRYIEQSDTYWAANQGQRHPACYVSPQTTSDLQTVLRTLQDYPSPFSIRSGGHSSVPSASNIVDGLTIDLSSFDSIAVSPDHTTITIGSGAKWSEVYDTLALYPSLAVSGARTGSVGVGGYLLGGGLSIFNSLTGWACDNILSMEVVLPNATTITASPSSNSDLFTALKGTSSNFGIVTSFTLLLTHLPEAFSSFDVFVLSYPVDKLTSVLELLSHNLEPEHSDPYISTSLGLAMRADSTPLIYVAIQTLRPYTSEAFIQPYLSLEPINVLYESMSQASFGKLVSDSNPPGFCQHKSTFTSSNNISHAESIVSGYLALFNHTIDNEDPNFQAGVLIQPLTLSHLRMPHGYSNPNSLGLSHESAPLILYSFEIRHTYIDPLPDTHYPSLLHDFISSASTSDQAHPFRYINYASSDQDGFGALRRDEKQWSWLQDVQKQYDPEGWWSTWNGGADGPFKVTAP